MEFLESVTLEGIHNSDHLDSNLRNPRSDEGLLGRNFSSAMLTPTAPGGLDFCTGYIKYSYNTEIMDKISLFSFHKMKGIFVTKQQQQQQQYIFLGLGQVWDNIHRLKEVTIQLQSKILWHLYVVIC